MPKQKLFEDESDEEVAIKTENQYAKKYDAWREKEERHKLEQKYGDKVLNSDASVTSDSEDESDEPPEVSEETETQFLKTLALLKTKDPRIYDPDYKFFDGEKLKESEKETKTRMLTFADSDEDDESGDIFTIEKKAPEIVNDNEKKTDTESSKTLSKEGKLKDFLIGKVEHLDKEVEQDLAPLKALWSDPKLNEGEAFLRDYILNKRYLDEGDVGDAGDKIRDDDDLEADEETVEEQGKFERAYNFRFEEPDEEYLKRFPRTMSGARPRDARRSLKRAEVRTRKEEEKLKKMEEIARLKALKLKEIQEKIARIKEVTGNEALAFKDEDIEGEFDPEEHDKRMRAIFSEEYYGEVDDQKPVFPDLDEELEIENWDTYEPEHDLNNGREDGGDNLHCEDEDFNMDADYDPKQARANLLEELKQNMGKKRRNRKRKSKLAELLSNEKPKFIPAVAEKTYSEYMEEYYKMDCEDVIGGDLPTRFKYREVVPNDYGLTVEEILLADDKELTQWVPLKKIVRYRPDNTEKGEVKTYAQKAADVRLKKKILPSLFKDLPEEPELSVPVEEASKKKKKKKKKNKQKDEEESVNDNVAVLEEDEKHKQEDIQPEIDVNELENQEALPNDLAKKKKNTNELKNREELEYMPNDTPKKKKNEHKSPEGEQNDNLEFNGENISQVVENSNKKKKKHKGVEISPGNALEYRIDNQEVNKEVKKGNQFKGSFVVENVENEGPSLNSDEGKRQNATKNSLKRKLENSDLQKTEVSKKKTKKIKNKSNIHQQNKQYAKIKFKSKDKLKNKDVADNPLSKLSDERLKAYGLNPKKYRSFLKYKKF